jgi:DNA repair protein RecO (recombination protein O)
MLQKTNGIVLRSVKYGDSSLITTIFTATNGVQSYMVQGVRSSKARQNRSGFFQPATLLELVVYQQPQKNLQHIREFQAAYIYTTLQEHVVKNSIALLSVEVLLRLLPEHAPMAWLFDFSIDYFMRLDKMPAESTANFPLFFIIQCSRGLGYELKGHYDKSTPYVNLHEGGFTEDAPASGSFIDEEDTIHLSRLLQVQEYDDLKNIEMNADMRLRLIDWYIAFLKQHTQHMGNLRSLTVLRTILH